MKKYKTLLGTTFIVTILIVLGKVLGFIREAIIADFYGATAETDAFFLAQSMPAMIFPAVCNSLSMAFSSIYIKRIVENGPESEKYASRMLIVTSVIGLVLGIIGVFISPIIVPLFAPGFTKAQIQLATYLTRITMGAFVFTMLQYMLAAILNSKKFFIGSQVSALFYNITIIVMTLLIGRGQTMTVCTLIVTAGLVVQVASLIVCCSKCFKFKPNKSLLAKDTGQLLKLALPILLGNSIVQINTIVDKALSSTLESGSMSALSYAGTLNTLVISIFVMSLSTVLFPTLADNAAKGNRTEYINNLYSSISTICLILVPIACISIIDSNEIVSIVFKRGSFDKSAVDKTAIVLAFYAPGFIFSGIREVVTRAFFAVQDTKTPMINSAIGVGCNIVFSCILVRFIGIAGIALGTTLAGVIISAMLLWNLKKKFNEIKISDFAKELLKQIVAGLVVFAVLLLKRHFIPIGNQILQFVSDVAIGLILYVFFLYILRSEDIKRAVRLVINKIRRKN